MMPRITDIVKHLIILNVLFYLGSRAILGDPGYYQLALFYPQSDFFQPYQLVTHMFMHGDLNHLIFNMLSLFFIGPMVEQLWQNKKFLFYFLACGFGAMAFHMVEWYVTLETANEQEYFNLLNGPVLGASGAVYGVLVAYAYLYPDRVMKLIFPPVSVRAVFLIMGLITFDTYLIMTGQRTGVAHFAHIGGAVTGLTIMYFWKNKGKLFSDQM